LPSTIPDVSGGWIPAVPELPARDAQALKAAPSCVEPSENGVRGQMTWIAITKIDAASRAISIAVTRARRGRNGMRSK
jgi:hypothetical protein